MQSSDLREYTIHLKPRSLMRMQSVLGLLAAALFFAFPFLAIAAGLPFQNSSAMRLFPPSWFVVGWLAIGLVVLISMMRSALNDWKQIGAFSRPYVGKIVDQYPLSGPEWRVTGLHTIGVPCRVRVVTPRYIDRKLQSWRVYSDFHTHRLTGLNIWVLDETTGEHLEATSRETTAGGEDGPALDVKTWLFHEEGRPVLWFESTEPIREDDRVQSFQLELEIIGVTPGEYTIRAEPMTDA